ncbi:MAG: hypothetical protein KKA51_02970 [Nanoarchaeota archaeon]|nr:hypothetical protein [Nanoarchaeota archaeon]
MTVIVIFLTLRKKISKDKTIGITIGLLVLVLMFSVVQEYNNYQDKKTKEFFDSFTYLDLGVENSNNIFSEIYPITNLGPKEAAIDENNSIITYREIKGPVYTNVKVPSEFDSIELLIKIKKEDLSNLMLGLQDGENSYKKYWILDSLNLSDYEHVEENGKYLYYIDNQSEKYDSVTNFLQNLPKNKKVGYSNDAIVNLGGNSETPYKITGFDEEHNMVDDGSFESFNRTVGDCCNGNPNKPEVFSEKSADAYEGNYSLKLWSLGHCACTNLDVNNFSNNSLYYFSFYYKGTNPKFCIWKSGENICDPSQTLKETRKWKKYQDIIKTSTNTLGLIPFFYADFNKEKKTNYYDDVKVFKGKDVQTIDKEKPYAFKINNTYYLRIFHDKNDFHPEYPLIEKIYLETNVLLMDYLLLNYNYNIIQNNDWIIVKFMIPNNKLFYGKNLKLMIFSAGKELNTSLKIDSLGVKFNENK